LHLGNPKMGTAWYFWGYLWNEQAEAWSGDV